ncbi:coagulation factor XIII B chain-like isoform X3 [Gambusia affinis]|uniref:coagulation factor XIII B chain-like isoform X3 n=1 Tax=Gambusia affinis TaxID=33528 RepID=UPI001CDD5E54|nr:coagulation factor XIII B chain-like isoform X3 [Gambusia affinis]
MEVRCLEFVLLLWVPGLLQAQGPQPCSAPSLDAGFFLPVQESYPHGTKISYSCNDGYKAERGGWWGTSTCFDGLWFGIPACIENPPTCREPPRISNATIINLDFQDVFTQDTEVVYQCKDGHTTKEGATKKSVFCRAGVWTDVPTCAPSTGPGSTDTHPTVTSCSCVLDLSRLNIGQTIQINMEDGEKKWIECTQWKEHWMVARCSNGKIEATSCCSRETLRLNRCWFNLMQ